MALFAISDLHLSLGTDKPMDIFGGNWKNYEQKLEDNWRAAVTDDDTVILNGDNSWATYLQNAIEDFTFINSLPGKKLLGKGNHDYWWTTAKKLREFCAENSFNTIDFLHNNHFLLGGYAVCGSRGWQITTNDDDDKKIYARELARLEFSLASAVKANPLGIIAALHYPPEGKCTDMSVYAAAAAARVANPDLLFVHFHGIDDINHGHTPESEEALAKILETEAYIQALMTGFSGRVIVVSDHGQITVTEQGIPRGNHGYFAPGDMFVPYYVFDNR